MTKASFALILMMALAGCVAPSGEPGPDSTADPLIRQPDDGGTSLTSSPMPENLRLRDCQSFSVQVASPLDALPRSSTVPEEWAPGQQLTYVPTVRVMDCAKVEWREFARGPIQFAWDVHNGIQLPESCWGQTSPVHEWYVGKVIVSDPEVASALAGLGVPAIPSTFSVQLTDLPGADAIRFAWDDGAVVEFNGPWNATTQARTMPVLMAWHNTTTGTSGFVEFEDAASLEWAASPAALANIPAGYFLSDLQGGNSLGGYAEVTSRMNHDMQAVFGWNPACAE